MALDNASMVDRRLNNVTTNERQTPAFARAQFSHALRLFVCCCAAFGGALTVTNLRAAGTLPATRVLERIPRTVKELDAAHLKSPYACEQLPAGVPLAPAKFQAATSAPTVTTNSATPGELASGRWPALTFGVRMTAADQARLPRFTSGKIMDRVNKNYVSLQVRVDRAGAAEVPYLHYQPLAAVGAFAQAEQTEKFASLQQAAVQDVRSLGLFCKPDEPRTADNLRTLVLSTKGRRVVADDTAEPPNLEPSLELIFIRMRVPASTTDAASAAVEIHAFITTHDLKQLVYLEPYETPAKPVDCALNSTIRLTDYSYGGQYPSARATRGIKYRERGRYETSALDAHARVAGLTSGALDNLTAVLDDVIDGRVKAKPE